MEQWELPEGWVITSLNHLIDLTSGKYIKRSEYSKKQDKSYPVAGAGGPIGWTDKKNFKAPIMTLGRVGAVGALNIYYTDAWVTDNVLVVIPHNNSYFDFLKVFFKTINWIEFRSINGIFIS